jgi:hypothetical protein
MSIKPSTRVLDYLQLAFEEGEAIDVRHIKDRSVGLAIWRWRIRVVDVDWSILAMSLGVLRLALGSP